MANQFNTVVTVIVQEWQPITITGPTGQLVTVSGPGGKITITFTSDVVNVIPLEEVVDEVMEVVEEVVEEDLEPLPLPVLQWPAAEPGAFFYKIDTMVNARKQLSSQFSRAECEDLTSLKMMNLKTYKKIFARLNLSANETRNLQSRIRRLEKPEVARASNLRQRERYYRQR
jgi:hypothetical protein